MMNKEQKKNYISEMKKFFGSNVLDDGFMLGECTYNSGEEQLLGDVAPVGAHDHHKKNINSDSTSGVLLSSSRSTRADPPKQAPSSSSSAFFVFLDEAFRHIYATFFDASVLLSAERNLLGLDDSAPQKSCGSSWVWMIPITISASLGKTRKRGIDAFAS